MENIRGKIKGQGHEYTIQLDALLRSWNIWLILYNAKNQF